jgi:hypothetical protein
VTVAEAGQPAARVLGERLDVTADDFDEHQLAEL